MLKKVSLGGMRALATAASGSNAAFVGLSGRARTAAEGISRQWQGTTADGGNTKNYINGQFLGMCFSVCSGTLESTSFCRELNL